jgi:hypothetical protein
LFAFSYVSVAYGIPSGGVYPPEFTSETTNWGVEWFDSFGFTRTNYAGTDGSNGFLPNVAYESIGDYKERAYNIGETFKTDYPQKVRRAEAILSYVQRWTDYGYDEENVFIEGTAQPEWAWNADEMAHMFSDTTLSVAIGDCEDMAFLCSTLFLAAGFDVALVSPAEHVALMIWLPEYSNANYYWDLNDGRGEGWIWVEATGEDNPLGWTPPDFTDGNFEVYLLSSSSASSPISNMYYTPQNPQAEDDVTVTVSVSSQSSSISKVNLHYSINGGTYRTLTVALSGSYYRATIPRQTDGTLVAFYASVTDTEGNVSQSNEYSYTVGEDLEIPGFPFESIVIGLVIGLAALYFISRRKSALSKPGVSFPLRSSLASNIK